MIPGLAGVVLVFVGIIITSLGVVRERQTGTLEQLAVMPLRPRDVFLGKIAPYFAVAAVGPGPRARGRGRPVRRAVPRLVRGVRAGRPAVPVRHAGHRRADLQRVARTRARPSSWPSCSPLPQVLLSGLIFPLSSIAVGVRWISYLLPLTYFNEISRGVMLRAEPIGPLWPPLLFLALLGLVVMTLAMLRFRELPRPGRIRGRRGAGRTPRPARRAPRTRPLRGPGERPAASAPQRRLGDPRRDRPVRSPAGPGPGDLPGPPWPGQRGGRRGRGGPDHAAALPEPGPSPPAAGTVARPRADPGRLPVRGLGHLPGPDRGREPGLPCGRLPGPGGRGGPADRRSTWTGPGWRARGTGWPGSCPAGCGRSSASSPRCCTTRPAGPGRADHRVDPVSRADLWSLIARAAAEGAAVVFATSYLDEAERAATCWSWRKAGSWPRVRPGRSSRPCPAASGDRHPAGRAGRARSWRRDGRWRVWEPRGRPGRRGQVRRPGPARPAGRGHGRDPGPGARR